VATFFDITAPRATVTLDTARRAEVVFTVGNATSAPIRGEAIVQPGPGADAAWFTVDRPERSWEVGESDQVSVAVLVPPGAPGGPRSFQLRVQLAGGVPEEDFDAGPSVTFEVPPPPVVPPDTPRSFPWWIVAVVAVVAVILVAGGVFIATRPSPTPSPTPAPTATVAPTPSPTPAPTPTPPLLPDLVVGDIQLSLTGVFPRTDVTVAIRNVGQADAGIFRVRVRLGDRSADRQVDGLAAGTETTFTLPFPPFSSRGIVVVDIDAQVEESDERNNVLSF
jgi:hypothetical protein